MSSSAKGAMAPPASTKPGVKAPSPDMSDIKFIFYALKQSFVALAFLRVIAGKFGGTVLDDMLAAIIAVVIGFLLRHKTTRKVLPSRVVGLWEPLRRIRKSRMLKLKACLLIDAASYAAYFHPLAVRLAFGKSGFTPIGVFLVQYLFGSFSLSAVSLLEIWTPAANFFPVALFGWLIQNKFVEKRELWRCVRDPLRSAELLKKAAKRAKVFAAEERERRKLGLNEEQAFERYTQAVGLQEAVPRDVKLAAAERADAAATAVGAAVHKAGAVASELQHKYQ